MKFSFRRNDSAKSPSPHKKEIMENFFDDFCASQAKSTVVRDKFDAASFIVDVEDAGEMYLINANLPGVKEKNINVTYKDKHITISAYKRNECIHKGKYFLRKERSWGRISRSFKLDPIDKASMQITFKDDVLEIKLNKVSDKEVM